MEHKEPGRHAPLVAGKYRILAELGRGGMGVVYRAEDTKLLRPVALKFLSEELSAGPEARARFLREARAAAHARRIVHRDIKPANIMLAGGRIAKITDFGLARIEGSGETTRTGGVVGTLAYMSPEQAQGLQTDRRADIWSLGCVIYEMLTGRTPFSPSPGQADMFALLQSDPRPVTAFRPDVPPRLASIVDRCLQKDPRCRYPDAASLVDDL